MNTRCNVHRNQAEEGQQASDEAESSKANRVVNNSVGWDKHRKNMCSQAQQDDRKEGDKACQMSRKLPPSSRNWLQISSPNMPNRMTRITVRMVDSAMDSSKRGKGEVVGRALAGGKGQLARALVRVRRTSLYTFKFHIRWSAARK